MELLWPERQTLERILPGLDDDLCGLKFNQRESPDNGQIYKFFRERGGPGLLVPERHLGLGASAIDAVHVQRAIGSRSPSLAVATTMHHFSIASLVEAEKVADPRVWMLLEAIATQRLLVSSGFAEGKAGQSILTPSIDVELSGHSIILNGSKKPCSLSQSMDLMTVSVVVPRSNGEVEFSVAIVPAYAPGLSKRPFWNNDVLVGTESHEVILTNVRVPLDLVVRTGVVTGDELDPVQTAGFIWFELLMSAAYLGAASALAERVREAGRGMSRDYVGLVIELEAAMNSLIAIAAHIDAGRQRDAALLLSALFSRYSVQDAIGRVADSAVETLGGTSFMISNEVTQLAACARALKFHPPSKIRSFDAISAALSGGPLILG
jgi:alkylation response protein AidB-like acyl-CoA dehydrogenase